MFGQNGYSRGADFICKIPIGGNPVAADETRLNPAILHDDGCHIVANKRDIDPRHHQFIGSQPGALQQRPRLIGEHLKVDSPLFPQNGRTYRGAILRRGKRPRIAVGQDAVSGLHQAKAVFRYPAAHFDILRMDRPAFIAKQADDLRNRKIPILFHDAKRAEDAAAALRLSASDLVRLKIADEMIEEPLGGAHRDHKSAALAVKEAVVRNLDELAKLSSAELKEQRYQKFRTIGSLREI